MILSIVSVLFAGILASCNRGSVSAETTAVLLGGFFDDGKTESYPCEVSIGDIGELEGPGAAVLNGQIVYCGGFELIFEHHRNCYKNVGTEWIEFESMNVARAYFTLTTVGDKILAVGGSNSQGETATMEVFNGSWKLQNYELTSARESHCAVPISQSQLAIIGGGNGGNGSKGLSLMEIYSIEEGFIAELPSMPTARWGLGCSMFKDEIWTAGGSNGEDLDVVEVFNSFTQTWRRGPTLTRVRYFLTIEALDNSLVVFGGYGNGVENSLEKLEKEEWREEPLQYKHWRHASVSITCN